MSKTTRIEDYLKNNVGNIVTARTIAGNCDCTVQTVYNYIKAHPSQFAKFDHGKFIFRLRSVQETDVTEEDTMGSIEEIQQAWDDMSMLSMFQPLPENLPSIESLSIDESMAEKPKVYQHDW